MTLHVRYRFWYISVPSSPKQQREITKLKLTVTESAPGLLGYIRQIERVEPIANKFEIFGSHF